MSDVHERLIHIADLHFWQIVKNPLRLINKRFFGNLTVLLRRRHEFMMHRAEEYADAVAATGASSAILTGDFSSTSTDYEFDIAAKFVHGLRDHGLSLHLVPGNHDVYTFGSVRTHTFERYFAPFIPPAGYPSLTALPGGTPLILAPTVCPRLISSRGNITDKTVGIVRKLLEQCNGTVIVAAHYPFLHQTHGYASSWNRRLANAKALRDVLADSGKQILYLAGHVHKFSYQADPEAPNLRQLTTGAFFRTETELATQGEFTEIIRKGDEFQVVRHVRKAEWETLDVEPV